MGEIMTRKFLTNLVTQIEKISIWRKGFVQALKFQIGVLPIIVEFELLGTKNPPHETYF